jgi:polysaccharide export outer membrane protein
MLGRSTKTPHLSNGIQALKVSKLWAVAVPALIMTGCAGRPALVATDRLQVLEQKSLPSPERRDLVAPDRAALVGPLDTILVEVFGVPDLSREVQVDASGRIAMPLIGMVDVSGKTTIELGRAIAERLRNQYVRNPVVTVNIKNSVSQVVTVDGEVKEPGLYPVTNQMTLMRALASAKGTTEFARLDNVVILRTVNGARYAGLYNLGAIRRGVYDDPYVYANDVVLVGDSPTRRLFKDILSIAPLLVGPTIALIQR